MRNIKGFTIVEMLITAIISAMLFLLVTNILIAGIKSQSTGADLVDLQKAQVLIITRITNDARWADEVAVNTSTNEITFIKDGKATSYFFVGAPQYRVEQRLPSGPTGPVNPESVWVTNFGLSTNRIGGEISGVNIEMTLQSVENPDLTYNSSNTVSKRISQVGEL